MIPTCMPLSLTLRVDARDYTTEQPRGNSLSAAHGCCALLTVPAILAGIISRTQYPPYWREELSYLLRMVLSLLDVEFVLAHIARYRCRHQIVDGQPLLATLADLSGRDVLTVGGECTAVDARFIGE
jgi:hypothetical protein